MISAAVIEALKEIVPSERILFQEPMKLHTPSRIGGPADCLIYLENEDQLCRIQKYLRLVDVPYTVIGNGSNLLVSDDGYRGIVLVVGKYMSEITVKDCYLEAEAGALMSQGAKTAKEHGLTGLEFAAGIPGTVGGGAGIQHLQYECPDKKFYPLSKDCVCHNMKLTTLMDVYNCVCGQGGEEIKLDENVRVKAKACIDTMLTMGE